MSRAVVINTVIMGTVAVLQRSLGLIGTTVLARILDPGGLGAFAFTQSLAQSAWGMGRIGIDAGLHVRLARSTAPQDISQFLGEGLTVFLAIAAAVAVLMVALAGPIAAGLYGAPELTVFVAIAAALFIGQALCQYAYVSFAGLHNFIVYSKRIVAGTALSVALGVAGAFAAGPLGAAAGFAVGRALTALMLLSGLVGLARAKGARIRPQRPSGRTGAMLTLGLPFYGSGLCLIPAEIVAMGAMSRALGVDALGDLRVILALVAVVQILPQALAGPIASHLAEREAAERGDGAAAALGQCRAIWVVALVGTIALAAVWPYAIVVIFGPAYALAREIGQMSLIAFIPTVITAPLTAALLATTVTKALFPIGVVQGVILLAIALPGIETIGMPAFFLGQAAAATAAFALHLWALKGALIGPALRPFMLVLLALSAVVAGLLVIDANIDETVWQRLTVAGAMLVLTLTLSWRFAFNRAERSAITQFAMTHAAQLPVLSGPATALLRALAPKGKPVR